MSYLESSTRRNLGFKMRSNMGEHNGSSSSSWIMQYFFYIGLGLVGLCCILFCISEGIKLCKESEDRRKRKA